MKTTLRRQVGRLFLVGLEGTELTSIERAWLRLVRPSGVILFRRNIEEARQTAALLREASKVIGSPTLRCVDLEGGLVDRLRDLIAPMPSAAEVFATGNPVHYREHGRLIAKEAKLLGFNTVLAPVLDLALPESCAVMRTRVVSANPDDVVRYASGFLAGLQAERILGCGKHFPGLGGGKLDSHHDTPVIQRSWPDMWRNDLLPFRVLAQRLPIVMISHAAYPRASGLMQPASISPFWISGVLRQRMGYRGLVLSDDMEMGGILKQLQIEDAVISAIAAGTDLIEICRNPALVLTAYEAVLSEAEKSPAFRRRITQAEKRVLETGVFQQPGPQGRISSDRLTRLREQIKAFSRINSSTFSCSVDRT